MAFHQRPNGALVLTATRDQLAMLAEVLYWAFQEGNLPSEDEDEFTIEVDENPAVYVRSNGEAICFEVLRAMDDEHEHDDDCFRGMPSGHNCDYDRECVDRCKYFTCNK